LHTYSVPNNSDGSIALDALEKAVRADDAHYPQTGCIALENTHNVCGGAYISPAYTNAVAEIARRNGVFLHIDGARIFNAAVAQDIAVSELTKGADSVTFCLSKGLCAPVGSLICGSHAFISKVHRARKQLGGGMRQAGILAAAGIVALQTMVDRLAEDHKRAHFLAQELDSLSGLHVEEKDPPTNMVYLRLEDSSEPAGQRFVSALAEQRIRINPPRGGRIRLVTHYWVGDSAVEKTIDCMRKILSN
jgi:threonine aldolase